MSFILLTAMTQNGDKSCKYKTDTIMHETVHCCLAKKLVNVDCLTLFTLQPSIHRA